MHVNRSALSQQHRVRHYAAASDAFGFFNQLTSPDLLDTLESTLPDHRERLFPPIMIFGGSPIRVAVPPMLEAIIMENR